MSARVPLPKAAGERTIAALLSVLFGLLGTICFLFVHTWTPESLPQRLFRIAAEHLFVTVAGICAALFVWSVFMPPWMERLMLHTQRRVVETLVAIIALSAIAVVSVYVLQ